MTVARTCKRGHVLDEKNTLLVNDSQRGIRKRCKECLNAPRRTGRPTVYMKSGQLTTEHHEDIEDLLSFGATFKEIIERGPFSSWDAMHRSLKRRERFDLIEKLKEKRELAKA